MNQHGTGVVRGEGPNAQSKRVWDRLPEDGGPARTILLTVVDAIEWVRRDPRRYQFHHFGDETPSRADARPERQA
jgi:hypothetical protein